MHVAFQCAHQRNRKSDDGRDDGRAVAPLKQFRAMLWSALSFIDVDHKRAFSCKLCGDVTTCPVVIFDGTLLGFKAWQLHRMASSLPVSAEGRPLRAGQPFRHRVAVPDSKLRNALFALAGDRESKGLTAAVRTTRGTGSRMLTWLCAYTGVRAPACQRRLTPATSPRRCQGRARRHRPGQCTRSWRAPPIGVLADVGEKGLPPHGASARL